MSPDDPRHGQLRGYRAGCREACCRAGIARYNQVRELRNLSGQPLTDLLTARGTQRRLQALMALGWSLARLEQHTGIDCTYLRVILRNNDRVAPKTADRVARAYDALSMTLPPNRTRGERQGVTRTLRYARAHGYAPPLAWDDIDLDPAPNCDTEHTANDDIDEAVILRVLAGDNVPTTRDERVAIVSLFIATGRPLADLERLGWKPERYRRGEDAA